METLIKLLLVHFIADFLLQWPQMLQSKEGRKFFSPYLYVHGFLHALLSAVLLLDIYWLPAIGIIAVTHIVIDGLKLTLTTEKNEKLLFFIDQLLHIIIIFSVWYYFSSTTIDFSKAFVFFWPHALFVFFITFPTSIFIQKLFLQWQLPEAAKDSLISAGVYIGFIERILIYIAVVTGNWLLIGFLIAAKSIFRFGDFSKTQDRKYAEYLFVGTMLSLFFAVLAGLCFIYVADYVGS